MRSRPLTLQSEEEKWRGKAYHVVMVRRQMFPLGVQSGTVGGPPRAESEPVAFELAAVIRAKVVFRSCWIDSRREGSDRDMMSETARESLERGKTPEAATVVFDKMPECIVAGWY